MTAVDYRRRAGRMLRVALLLSLLIHFGGAGIYGILSARWPRSQGVVPRPRESEAFVTLSQALTFDKRPRPVPRPQSRPHPHPALHPASHPLAVARLISAPLVHASIPRPQARAIPVPKGGHAAPAVMTREQIARLNQDFAQTIAASHGASDPLRVSTRVPTAVKHYRLQFDGRIGTLRVGQGILTPIKKWSSDGYSYYYVTYEIVWPDGTYESGAVPWPIRYLPSNDPFASGIPGQRIPLPAPLPGWTFPSDIRLGKALRDYFPGYKAADEGPRA
jgi:hypothetical protein